MHLVLTQQQIRRKNIQSGFSLIEMLVSLAIFTIVITMSVSTLLVLIDANGRAQSMQLVMTNLTFTVDSLTREVRTGYNWYCTDYTGGSEPTIPSETSLQDCTAGSAGNVISVVESDQSLTTGLSSKRVTYWFDDDYYGAGHGAILRRLGETIGDGDWIPMTAEEIEVDSFTVVVTNTDRQSLASDTLQPTATFFLKGTSGVTDTQTRQFEIGSTVTQRLIDV